MLSRGTQDQVICCCGVRDEEYKTSFIEHMELIAYAGLRLFAILLPLTDYASRNSLALAVPWQ
jgi:hypothetical protein